MPVVIPIESMPVGCGLKEAQRTITIADEQIFLLLVVVKGHLVALSPNARLLVTPKGRMGWIRVVTVHPYSPRLNAPRHAIGLIGITGPNAGA